LAQHATEHLAFAYVLSEEGGIALAIDCDHGIGKTLTDAIVAQGFGPVKGQIDNFGKTLQLVRALRARQAADQAAYLTEERAVVLEELGQPAPWPLTTAIVGPLPPSHGGVLMCPWALGAVADLVAKGFTPDDAVRFAKLLESAGIDYISVSGGMDIKDMLSLRNRETN
jgi:hypothetical protein